MPDVPELSVLTERSIVPNNTRSEIDVAIEIRFDQQASQIRGTRALNLCIVVDRSGSMDGSKLETAKQSCLEIFNQLGPEDHFTLVMFDDEATVVVNPLTSRDEVAAKIQAITAGGQTHLSAGWNLGLLELQTYTSDRHNNRLILLSDGQANRGETKRSVLGAEAAKARELGVTASTIGIGDDFQEDLLEAIATESGGRFWYIQETKIQGIIDEEFQGSLSVVVDRPRLELVLPPGARIGKELNRIPKSAGRYRIRPLKGKDLFNLAVRLEIIPDQLTASTLHLGAILYDGDSKLVESGVDIPTGTKQEFVLSKVNPVVKSIVQQYEATITSEMILREASFGRIRPMASMLDADIGRMHDMIPALAADTSNARALEVLEYFRAELAEKESSLAMLNIFAVHSQLPEVQNFMRRWRKSFMQGHSRQVHIANVHAQADREAFVPLLETAIDLVDLLSERYPDKEASLKTDKEALRAALARYQ